MRTRVTVGFLVICCGAVAYWFYPVEELPSGKSGSVAITSAAITGPNASAETQSAMSQSNPDEASSVSTVPSDLGDEQNALSSEEKSEAELYRGMTYSELPIDVRERGLERLRKQGYFPADDWQRSGYATYGQETIIELAKNGDALAEHMVVANMSDYSEEVRKEIALSSAMHGRTAGLHVLGSEPFYLIKYGRSLQTDIAQPTTGQLIEGYGMMLVADRMGDDSSLSENEYYAFARGIMPRDQILQAEEFANKLFDSIEQGAID